MKTLIAVLGLLLASSALAEEIAYDPLGEVRVPLAVYTALMNQLDKEPGRAPAPFAIAGAGALRHRSVPGRGPDHRR
jgi:hypothetical protein